ncbi:heterokaryon incompatibility protein-domain-containing protein [Immersiella caudata]|uniref:Heterokaryon incompatibility protein-domain-containing protein n=1 Tax=Immersiella caudata TaxID=314043 RepID=A0AA40CAP2_9PEZI|nr:heterokaryon incompatibility protein-domain-containing protein [Immersiella caudata]
MAPLSYKYQTLADTHSIRLLYIRHDETKPHALSLSLREVDLDSIPEFLALSYTWRSPVYAPETAKPEPSPERYYDVECDDKTTTVSSNLLHFFQNVLAILQRPQSHQTPRENRKSASKLKLEDLLTTLPIWIDALCIDQANSSERQHQVLLMDRIYSRAKHVIVWLSPLELDPKGSVVWVHNTFIPAVAKLTASDPAFVTTCLAVDPLCESRKIVDRLGAPICTHWAVTWLGFANFLDRHRWFDRGWVVQVVALGRPQHISVLCGRTELSWVRLSAFSRFLHQTGWAQSLRNTLNSRIMGRARAEDGMRWTVGSNRRAIGWRIRSIEDIRRLVDAGPIKGMGRGDAMRLWILRASSLIGILRSSDFEDHRDHVYGGLGMLSKLLPEGVGSPITPDYGVAVGEVFTSVASTFITGTRTLLELSQVEDRRHRRYSHLPSWVPDYSVHPGDSRIRAMSEFDLSSIPLLNDAPHIPPPIVEGPKMVVHGIRLDTCGPAALRFYSDSTRFRNNLLDLLLSATAIHTTMAQIFFTTLNRGNPKPLIRASPLEQPQGGSSSLLWLQSDTPRKTPNSSNPSTTAGSLAPPNLSPSTISFSPVKPSKPRTIPLRGGAKSSQAPWGGSRRTTIFLYLVIH